MGRFELLKNGPVISPKKPKITRVPRARIRDTRRYTKIDCGRSAGRPFCLAWLFQQEPILLTGSLARIQEATSTMPLCHAVVDFYRNKLVFNRMWCLFGTPVQYHGQLISLQYWRRTKGLLHREPGGLGEPREKSQYVLSVGNHVVRTFLRLPRSPLRVLQSIREGSLVSPFGQALLISVRPPMPSHSSIVYQIQQIAADINRPGYEEDLPF